MSTLAAAHIATAAVVVLVATVVLLVVGLAGRRAHRARRDPYVPRVEPTPGFRVLRDPVEIATASRTAAERDFRLASELLERGVRSADKGDPVAASAHRRTAAAAPWPGDERTSPREPPGVAASG